MNHIELTKELLKLNDEALRYVRREEIATHRALAEAYVNGEELQCSLYGKNWTTVVCPPTFSLKPEQYRIKPRTININGYEVPEPVRNPKIVCPVEMRYSRLSSFHITLGEGGLLFKTRDDCQAYCDAVLSFTKAKDE
jgi:hypothetical protein